MKTLKLNCGAELEIEESVSEHILSFMSTGSHVTKAFADDSKWLSHTLTLHNFNSK